MALTSIKSWKTGGKDGFNENCLELVKTKEELLDDYYDIPEDKRFMFKDLKDRETIVRYIFEEERKMRRKEMETWRKTF